MATTDEDEQLDLGVSDYLANRDHPVGPRLKDSLAYGVQQQPDTQARIRKYARDLNVPLPAALGDAEHVQAQGRAFELNPNGLLKETPKTASWLAEPDNAAVAHDDTKEMGTIERWLRLAQQGVTSAPLSFDEGVMGVVQMLRDSYLQAGRKAADTFGDTKGVAAIDRLLARDITGKSRQDIEAVKDDMMVAKPQNAVESGIYSGFQSLAQNAPIVAAAIATRNPEMAAGAMGALTGGQAYGEGRQAGQTPGQAMRHGLIQGTIETGTEMIPMGDLVKDVLGKTGLGKTIAKQLIEENVGEQIATFTQDLDDWLELHPEKTAEQFWNERGDAALATFVATNIGVGGNVALAETANAINAHVQAGQQRQQQAQESQRQNDFIEGLMKSATASALRARDPQTFKEFVDHVTEDTPVDRVYVNAVDLVDALAQGSPEAVAQSAELMKAMPSVAAQIEDAYGSNGLVEIPISELLAYTPDTHLAQSLIEHLKVDPESMSMAEADAFLQSQGESLKAEVAKAVEGQANADVFQASAEKVHAGLKTQLDAANRFTPDVNDAYAGLVTSFYSTMAARIGTTPEALAEAHSLTIRAQGVSEGSLMASAKPSVSFQDFAEGVKSDLGLAQLDVHETRAGDLRVGMMALEPADQKQGKGSAALERLTAYADAVGKRLTLSPAGKDDRWGTTSRGRLVTFYKRFGFKENKGRTTDHSISDKMIREPQPLTDERAELVRSAYEDLTPEGLQQSDAHFSYEPGLGFQSSLFNTVLNAGQGKASADQWLATLRNAPGVKKEEIEWIGLPEGLKLMGMEGAITREQVLAFIAQNGVRLEEIILDEAEPSAEDVETRAQEMADENSDNDTTYYASDYHEAAYEELSGSTKAPKWSEYQAIKGGTNYRELLLILPKTSSLDMPPGVEVGSGPNPTLKRSFTAGMGHWDDDNVLAHARLSDFTTPDGKRVLGVQEVQSDWHQKGRDKGYARPASPEEVAAADAAFKAAIEVRNEYGNALLDIMPGLMLDRIAELEEKRDAARSEEQRLEADYQAAWVRINAATEAHDPVARGEAYTESATIATAARKAKETADKAADQINDLKRLRGNLLVWISERTMPAAEVFGMASRIVGNNMSWSGTEHVDRFVEMHDLRNNLRDADLKLNEAEQRLKQARGEGGIPDAPFKATWPALVMKRILRMAIEQGYDAVAWATGEQQADLYDMREHIDSITAQPVTDTPDMPDSDHVAVDFGSHSLNDQIAGNVGAQRDSRGALLTREQLAAVVGSELAARIYDQTMAARGEPGPTGYYEQVPLQTFTGADLTVGGEGHKAFYNRNLVNMTNDIIKKFGGKVGRIQINAKAERGGATPEELIARIADYKERIEALETEKANIDIGPGDEANRVRYRETMDEQIAYVRERIANAEHELAEAQPSQPGFEINDKMRTENDAVHPKLFQEPGTGPRGAFSPQTNTITILRNADLSTFLHETGHFFLETMARMAADEATPADVKADWAKAAKFIGFDGIDPAAWLAIPVDGRREAHETFARGFEAYLREGKAPSRGLTGLFQKFRSWLLQVYQNLTQLNVTLTDEVRGVFDRLLATEQDIAAAEATRGFAPIFETKPEGMTDIEWEAYQRLGAEATADAEDELAARSIRDMQWLRNARARIIADLRREAREKRAATRAEVSAEVIAQPIYRAMQFLKRGVLDGEAAGIPHKLSIEELQDIYGDNPGAPWQHLGYGKYGMLASAEGGNAIHPDQAAELFGFSSGDHLVRELLAAEPMNTLIEGMTDQRMLERYGDLVDDRAIAKAADEAIHNDARLRFVATEANALAKATGKVRVLAEAARDYARELIARQRIRDLKPARYTGAETRAAVAAARLAVKGNLVEAATEKRNQLINGYAAKAAFEAQKEVEKALRFFARLQGEGARKNMDADYRDQIDQLLERFDLRKGETLRSIDKRKSLARWIEAMKERGLEPLIDDDLANEAYRKHYRDMTVEEMRGLVDAVKNIAHLGRLKNRLLVAANQRAFSAVVEEAAALIRDNAYKTNKAKIESNTALDSIGHGFASFFTIHRKFASLIREMSGLKNEGGILWRAFIQPMNKANDREASMREQATVALADIYKPLVQKGGLRKKLYIPEIGTSLSLEGRLAVALNWGNELNRARIMDGDKWTADQASAVLRTLTAEQLGFVNRMWEYLDTFFPLVAAKERRVSGVEPQKVEAEPFQVQSADGQLVDMRGGYYPIKYDTLRSSRSKADAESEPVINTGRGLYARATTRRGHTKARVEKVERPVRKDLSVPFGHVSEVIHDLAFHEYLIDANRLISAAEIDQAIRDHYNPEVLDAIKATLKDIAEGELGAQNGLEAAMNYIRTGTTIVGLGWNLMTGLLQPLGLTQSIVRVGPKYMAKGIAAAFKDAVTLQNTVERIGAKSDFMRTRAKTFMREINEVQNQVKDSVKPAIMGPVEASFFVLIQKLQLIADVPTWLGAYDKALAGGEDETDAVAMADQAVRDSQGSGQTGDLAQIQRGNVWFKLWTNFYSFFNIGYNQMAESLAETRRVGPSRLPLLAADVALVAFIPAILGELMKAAIRGDDWDDEWKKLAKAQVSYLLGFMVGLRELGGIVTNDGKAVSGPASLRLLTSDLPKAYQQIQQGEWDDAARKAFLNVSGTLFHFPAGQINRTIDGIEALAKGETNRPTAILVGPPHKAR